MNSRLSIIKGVHPGFILERELKKRELPKSRFALLVNEYPQTLVSITKGKRSMNTALALKIEHALKFQNSWAMRPSAKPRCMPRSLTKSWIKQRIVFND